MRGMPKYVLQSYLEHLQQFAKTTCYPWFFGKTRKIKLQQFGIWLGKFSQLAIHRSFTRIFARGRGLAIALPSRELPAPPPLPRTDGTFTLRFPRHPGLVPLHISLARLEEPAAPASSSRGLDPDPIAKCLLDSNRHSRGGRSTPDPEVRHPWSNLSPTPCLDLVPLGFICLDWVQRWWFICLDWIQRWWFICLEWFC